MCASVRYRNKRGTTTREKRTFHDGREKVERTNNNAEIILIDQVYDESGRRPFRTGEAYKHVSRLFLLVETILGLFFEGCFGDRGNLDSTGTYSVLLLLTIDATTGIVSRRETLTSSRAGHRLLT